MPPIRGLPGTKFALSSKGIRPGPGISTPVTCSLPSPCSKLEIGSKVVSLEVHWQYSVRFIITGTLVPPSIPITFIAVLRTTLSSGRHTPSTCPNGLKLVEHQESRSSTIFLSKSMSHSRGVNSARAERVVGWTLAYSFWLKAVDAP